MKTQRRLGNVKRQKVHIKQTNTLRW